MVHRQAILEATMMVMVMVMATAMGPDVDHDPASNPPALAPLGAACPHQNQNLSVPTATPCLY